ncbi:hypothetical protein G52EAM_00505 [Candidatus Nanoperiomorbus periodonticus]|nr:hypothetical protein G52EAM_00505 [Candidatus Nanoperiomorbus periodonticus]
MVLSFRYLPETTVNLFLSEISTVKVSIGHTEVIDTLVSFTFAPPSNNKPIFPGSPITL